MTFLTMPSFAEVGQPSGHILPQCAAPAVVLREDGFYRVAGHRMPEMRLVYCYRSAMSPRSTGMHISILEIEKPQRKCQH